MTGYELHFIQLYCSAKHINLSVMYLCRKVKSRWGLVQFKLQTELRHLKSWFILQFFKVVIYWTHFVAQLNILALQCQAADFWNYQAKNELWSRSLTLAHWHFWDGLVVAEHAVQNCTDRRKKTKHKKKLSKEYLLSNDARNKYRLDRLETSQSRFFV